MNTFSFHSHAVAVYYAYRGIFGENTLFIKCYARDHLQSAGYYRKINLDRMQQYYINIV